MEPGGLILHLQGLSNNLHPEPTNPVFILIPISLKSILIFSSHLRLGIPKALFPVGLPVTILNEFLPYSIHAT